MTSRHPDSIALAAAAPVRQKPGVASQPRAEDPGTSARVQRRSSRRRALTRGITWIGDHNLRSARLEFPCERARDAKLLLPLQPAARSLAVAR